jgi:hypothetical protein
MHDEELISAALDGEHVDLERLNTALADPGGRDALASFVLLRAAVAADDSRPAAEFYESMAPALRPPTARRLLRGPRMPVTVAASILVFAAAGSFWLGSQSGGLNHPARTASGLAAGNSEPTAGPPGARPGASSREVGRSPDDQPRRLPPVAVQAEPPVPVRVVRFDESNWREGS